MSISDNCEIRSSAACDIELFEDFAGDTVFVFVSEHRHIVHGHFEIVVLAVHNVVQVEHYHDAHQSVAVENVRQATVAP